MSNTLEETQKHVEAVAMNIVYQIGDALYEALPPDVAHEHFVKARQATNDIAIDFAMKLILSEAHRVALKSFNNVKYRLPDPNNNVEEWKGHNLGLSQAIFLIDEEIERLSKLTGIEQ